MTAEQKLELDKILDSITIAGPYTKTKLRARAIRHYKKLWTNNPIMLKNIDNSSEKQIEQWMVNYIRHKLTGYDKAVVKVNELIPGGYEILRIYILDKISCVYPFLKEECERQKAKSSWRIW